jgi:predicted DNA-binding transcriptional regulator AlpA
MGKILKKEIYILYIIKKQHSSILKIGKTKSSNFKSRISNIEKDFGKIDFSNSYIVYSEIEREVSTLERLLHKSYEKDRLPKKFKTGVGKTEWFKSNILNNVLKQINYLKKNNNNYIKLSRIKRMDEGREKHSLKSQITFYINLFELILIFIGLIYLFKVFNP